MDCAHEDEGGEVVCVCARARVCVFQRGVGVWGVGESCPQVPTASRPASPTEVANRERDTHLPLCGLK